jgi:8-oxo-dGTP pyrophosphatase MutT (NUDIX family)
MEQRNVFPPGELNRTWIAQRLTAGRRRQGLETELRGDHFLNPHMHPKEPLIKAAVLVPLIERNEEMTVLLTKRTDHLDTHAGQISFPGGRMEDCDASAEDTALRETLEEVGLDTAHIEILGRLSSYITRTGFDVAPIIGVVSPPFSLTPDPYEVADVFETPLAFLLDPANRHIHSHEVEGKTGRFYAMPHGDNYIWGATAGILVSLHQALME